MVKNNFTLGIFKFLCIRCIKNLNIRIHDLQKTLNSCDTTLKLLRKFNDFANGRYKRGYIHDIRHHISRKDFAIHKEESATNDNCQIHQTIKDSRGGAEQSHKHIAVFFDTQKLLVSLLKFFCFKHFICKSFYNLLSKKTVLNPGIQLSDLVSLSAESTFYFFVDKTTHYRHNRHKNEHHQCQ